MAALQEGGGREGNKLGAACRLLTGSGQLTAHLAEGCHMRSWSTFCVFQWAGAEPKALPRSLQQMTSVREYVVFSGTHRLALGLPKSRCALRRPRGWAGAEGPRAGGVGRAPTQGAGHRVFMGGCLRLAPVFYSGTVWFGVWFCALRFVRGQCSPTPRGRHTASPQQSQLCPFGAGPPSWLPARTGQSPVPQLTSG